MMDNARTSRRVGTRIFVQKVLSEHEDQLCRAMNLSRDGCYLLEAPEEVSRKQRFIWLKFWLPNSEEMIQVLGEVTRDEAEPTVNGTGVRFRYVAPFYQRLIDQYLGNFDEMQAVGRA
jgi:hypothetical protein